MKPEYPMGMFVIGVLRNLFYKCYILLIVVSLFALRMLGSQIPIILPIIFLVAWITWSIKAQMNHKKAIMNMEMTSDLLDVIDVLSDSGGTESKSGIEEILKIFDDLDD